MGFHFGTYAQALDRARINAGERKKRIERVYLNITNPYVLEGDLMNWEGSYVAQKILTGIEHGEYIEYNNAAELTELRRIGKMGGH